MLFRRRRATPSARTAISTAERDESAYTLLEEARMRCEQLLAAAHGEPADRWLHALHRELGTAGFLASENIASHRRTGLLELAREQAAVPAQASELITALAGVMAHALRAVEEALIAPGLSDHMHTARQHLASAADMLDDHRTQNRPHPGVGAEIGEPAA